MSAAKHCGKGREADMGGLWVDRLGDKGWTSSWESLSAPRGVGDAIVLYFPDGISDRLGFHFLSSSAGSRLSGIKILNKMAFRG